VESDTLIQSNVPAVAATVEWMARAVPVTTGEILSLFENNSPLLRKLAGVRQSVKTARPMSPDGHPTQERSGRPRCRQTTRLL
jgi:hypothetical protein